MDSKLAAILAGETEQTQALANAPPIQLAMAGKLPGQSVAAMPEAPGESFGGGAQAITPLSRPTIKAQQIPDAVYAALGKYAKGGSTRAVHESMPPGWSVRLRTKTGVEVTAPDGTVHWIDNGDF